MHIGQTEAAISSFEHCLVLGENALQYMVLKGAGTFYPCYYLGNCYEMRGLPGDAAAWYRRALEYSPAFVEAAVKLSQLGGGEQVPERLQSGNRAPSVPSLRKPPLRSTATPENTWSIALLLGREGGRSPPCASGLRSGSRSRMNGSLSMRVWERTPGGLPMNWKRRFFISLLTAIHFSSGRVYRRSSLLLMCCG